MRFTINDHSQSVGMDASGLWVLHTTPGHRDVAYDQGAIYNIKFPNILLYDHYIIICIT